MIAQQRYHESRVGGKCFPGGIPRETPRVDTEATYKSFARSKPKLTTRPPEVFGWWWDSLRCTAREGLFRSRSYLILKTVACHRVSSYRPFGAHCVSSYRLFGAHRVSSYRLFGDHRVSSYRLSAAWHSFRHLVVCRGPRVDPTTLRWFQTQVW